MSDVNNEQYDVLDVGNDATLLVQGGPRNGEIIPLTSEETSLGRQSDNDIVIDEPAVSRRHSTIVVSPNGFFLRDLGSTNGTFVNRLRIFDAEHPLNNGDLIRMGGSDITFLFRYAGAKTLRISVVEPLWKK